MTESDGSDDMSDIECDGGPYCQAVEHVEGCFATMRRRTEVERLREARLYGEKMLRDHDPQIRRCGADLLQIIGPASDITALPPD